MDTIWIYIWGQPLILKFQFAICDYARILVEMAFFWHNALCSHREQLGILDIFKSNGWDFAQFWSKFDHFNFGWCRTVKRLQDKYFLQIFVKSGSYISQKHEGGGLINMKFGVWSNQIVPSKKVENNIFISAALHGANIFQIFFTC